ncbi:hypothetical protein LARI1_G005163 [Lachnellula arida]|uniref:Uncharacterized protein n=1 Tax=Lachnellula arida TaxID=1316785 RepID=A0A8T9B3U3_9HELO|nr:hypothetical protein LARI1_G005163 [Lachnellula arida]
MASMKTANRLKVAMDAGSAAFGCWQMAPGSNISRTLARTGVDFVVVDCERESTRPILWAITQRNQSYTFYSTTSVEARSTRLKMALAKTELHFDSAEFERLHNSVILEAWSV